MRTQSTRPRCQGALCQAGPGNRAQEAPAPSPGARTELVEGSLALWAMGLLRAEGGRAGVGRVAPVMGWGRGWGGERLSSRGPRGGADTGPSWPLPEGRPRGQSGAGGQEEAGPRGSETHALWDLRVPYGQHPPGRAQGRRGKDIPGLFSKNILLLLQRCLTTSYKIPWQLAGPARRDLGTLGSGCLR